MLTIETLIRELNNARQALRDHLAAEARTREHEDRLTRQCLERANERTRYWQERALAAEERCSTMIIQAWEPYRPSPAARIISRLKEWAEQIEERQKP